jgi:protoheme IX farnesyltransferase
VRRATEGDGEFSEGDRLTPLLAATAVGVYLLVIAGTTTAVTDAASACPTWPVCEGAVLGDTALAVAWTHRLVAAVVGLLALSTVALAWRQGASDRVRAAATVPLVLYPVQVGVGAMTAVGGTPATLSGLHLAAGVVIFGGFLLALTWHLEERTAGQPDEVDTESDDGGTTPADPGRSTAETDGDPPYTPPESVGGRLLAQVRAYVELTKPRLMWLLCLVAFAAMALAAGPTLDTATVVATLGGGVLAIGASGTFNNVLERDVDRRMNRTADRPIVTDRVGVYRATAFGVVLAVASLLAFLSVNLLAAVLGLTAIVFYSVVYTLVLKPNTVQNTVVGGAAGALPALIGWAAVRGTIEVPALLLATVIFLWTPAHFYNLALAYREDYERGGFPMLPVVRGEAVTRKHVLLYLGATLVGAVALGAVTDLGAVYALTSAALGAVFLWAAVRLHREQTDRAAMRTFHAANAYLGSVLVAVAVDAAVV